MMTRPAKILLFILGLLLVIIYLLAARLGDLRANTIAFEWLYFPAFALYGLACFLVLRVEQMDDHILYGIFALAMIMNGILIFTRPTLSDDMFRYVWDGRVQAQGISPYLYPPDAPQLAPLRNGNIYPSINRKDAVTIYPPAAEASFALLWRLWPDNIHWFQTAMAIGGLAAGFLLAGLLRDLKLSPARALIFLWSPLLLFETAHSAHVDGLFLPFLVGAWWARLKERDATTGFLLGIATAMKLYPALLLPFLWRPRDRSGWWRMPLAFGATVGLFYLPYTITSGWQVLGYLPNYFGESFNVSPLVSHLNEFLAFIHWDSPNRLIVLAVAILSLIAVYFIFRPAPNPETALRRCLWPIAIVTLLSQDLFSWYMLWLLPLIAIFLRPSGGAQALLRLPRLDAWTGWWLFSGLIGLSYTFFIQWKPVDAAILAQFVPLYLFLLIDLVMRFRGVRLFILEKI